MTAAAQHTARLEAVGDLLRHWRSRRRMSQMTLSFEAGVSTRHLSCIETGKAAASRSVLKNISDALELSLRERNRLFAAAGYAPEYSETPIDADGMSRLNEAIGRILKQHAPFPAFAMDGRWNVLRSNNASKRMYEALMGRQPRHGNLVRKIFDEDDVRPFIVNWDETAVQVFHHLLQQAAATPDDEELNGLIKEIEKDAIFREGAARDVSKAALPIFTTIFAGNGRRFEFFSTLTTFGGARDVTLDEMRIEAMFPADDATEAFFRSKV